MRKMNKNTSIILIVAVAGIMIAGTLAVTLTTVAFASWPDPSQVVIGNERAGGYNHQRANGGDANGGHGGDANGGNSCNNRCGANS